MINVLSGGTAADIERLRQDESIQWAGRAGIRTDDGGRFSEAVLRRSRFGGCRKPSTVDQVWRRQGRGFLAEVIDVDARCGDSGE